jgi:hypothetical protein
MTTQKSITKYLLMVLAIVAWNYWIPLFVAVCTHTLTYRGVEEKTREICKPCNEKLDKIEASERQKQQMLAEILASSTTELEPLLTKYMSFVKYESEKPREIYIAAYENSQTRHFFFISYLSLSGLIAWQAIRARQNVFARGRHGRAIQIGFLLFLLWGWSNWWRNTPFGHTDRRLFSYAHFDITALGFVTQEFQAFGMMILCGYLIVCCLDYISVTSFTIADPGELSNLAKCQFEAWQSQSVLLLVAFLPWTLFYWRTATSIGDHRYMPSAIGIHLIWILIWALITAPAWCAIREWQKLLTSYTSLKSVDEIKKIRMLDPVSRNSKLASAIAAGVSLVYPLLQNFISEIAGN